MTAHDNLLAAHVIDDPYAYFGALRESDPVHWNASHKSWIVTRYDDVAAGLRDPRLSSNRIAPYQLPSGGEDEPTPYQRILESLSRWLVFLDPPEHTRLRKLVQRAFTPRTVEQLRPRIADLVAEVLQVHLNNGLFDVMTDLAYPLPAIVIAELLGIPSEDRDQFQKWSAEMSTFLFGALDSTDRHERAEHGLAELNTYLREMVRRYRLDPGDNLITELVRARDDGERLSEDDVIGTCALLLFAGHETTTNLIGNGTLALLRHPDQLRLLRDDPSLSAMAVEELLRFDGPSKLAVRWVAEDLVMRGQQISRGERVLLVQASANRDPRRFENPDHVDITRIDNAHLGFGMGIHYCLGGPLARIEGQIAFEALSRLSEELHLTTERVRWEPNLLTRGLGSLIVRSTKTVRADVALPS